MDPTVWGPPAWTFLHTVTLTYPDQPTPKEKQAMAVFFQSLSEILPCQACQRHYARHLQRYPIAPALANKTSLIRWLITLHNQVNVSLGKPVLDLPTAIREISKPYLAQATSKNPWGFWVSVVVALVAITALLWWKYPIYRHHLTSAMFNHTSG